jgi:hypothetical protein
MTTARKVRANRQNARASTGPKSATGKARSSVNARRHRLAVPIWSDPVLTANVVALAKHIAGVHPSQQVMAYAQQVADAQIEIVRVRRWRLDLMHQRLSPLLLENPDDPAGNAELSLKKASIISNLTPELQSLDRYERRAVSRRNRAIQSFTAVRVVEAHSKEGAKRDETCI